MLRSRQRFCLQHVEIAAVACLKKCKEQRTTEEKDRLHRGSSCLSCTGACKVAEILRPSLDGEEMSISSISLIFQVKLSPHFATPVPPALRLPPVPLGPEGCRKHNGRESFHPSQTLKSSARQSHHRGETFLHESPLVSRVGRGRRRQR